MNKREDLQLWNEAEQKGWKVGFHKHDILNGNNKKDKTPDLPIHFEKKEKILWVAAGKWVCADYDKSPSITYSGHRYYPTLKEALDKE
jgi:hypothetical protein